MEVKKIIHMLYWIVLVLAMFGVWGYFIVYRNKIYSIIAAAVFLALFLSLLIYSRLCLKKGRSNEIKENERSLFWVGLILAAVCFLTRLIYTACIDSSVVQLSDFGIILKEAVTGKFTDEKLYFQLFPHKFFYPFLLHVMKINSQMDVFIIQSTLSGITAFLIFSAGGLLKSHKIGLIAEILYIIWPAQLIYTSVVTEEHFAATCQVGIVCLILYIFNRVHREENKGSRTMIWIMVMASFVGILMSICRLFKDWGTIAFIAIVLCAIPIITELHSMRKILGLLVAVFVLFICKSVTANVAMDCAEKVLEGKVNRGNAVYYYVALDPNSSGGYNKTLYDEYTQLVEENGYNYAYADRMAKSILTEKLKTYSDKVLTLLWNKGWRSQTSNFEIFEWALMRETTEDFIAKYGGLIDAIVEVDRVYYIWFVITMLVGAALFAAKEERLFFVLMYVFGGALVSFLVESQGRYKYSIEPFWCVCCAFIMALVLESASTIIRKESIKHKDKKGQ